MTTQHIQIIGICGKKFSGKDTIADYLVIHHGYTKISLGDPLKRAIQNIFGFSDEQLWGNQKEIIDSFWNVTPREMLQYFGTDCFRQKFGFDYPQIGSNIWIRATQRKINDLIKTGVTKFVIPDMRFGNEMCVIHSFNGKIIRVNRPLNISCDTHVSEKSLDEIMVDYIITNNSIEKLFSDVEKVLSLISWNFPINC